MTSAANNPILVLVPGVANLQLHATMERVAVNFHVKDRSLYSPVVTKVWRFNPQTIGLYTRASVQADLLKLFPDVARRELKFEMWYYDDIAGEVYTIYIYI